MTNFTTCRPEPRGHTHPRWKGVTFGLAIGIPTLLTGILFCLFLYLAYARAKETRSWIPGSCLIEESEVGWKKTTPHSPVRYYPKISYRYQIAGRHATSTRIKRVDGSSSSRESVEKLIANYPAGSVHTCFIDPKDPTVAILEHASIAPIYTIWFPCLFVLGGLGIILGGMRRRG